MHLCRIVKMTRICGMQYVNEVYFIGQVTVYGASNVVFIKVLNVICAH